VQTHIQEVAVLAIDEPWVVRLTVPELITIPHCQSPIQWNPFLKLEQQCDCSTQQSIRFKWNIHADPTTCITESSDRPYPGENILDGFKRIMQCSFNHAHTILFMLRRRRRNTWRSQVCQSKYKKRKSVSMETYNTCIRAAIYNYKNLTIYTYSGTHIVASSHL
jgi:hypothetical protein